MNDIKKKGKAEVKNSFYKDLFFLTFGEFKQQVQIYSILFKKHSLGVENSSFFLGLLLISCIYRVIC